MVAPRPREARAKAPAKAKGSKSKGSKSSKMSGKGKGAPIAPFSPVGPPLPTPAPPPTQPNGLCFETNEDLREGVAQFFSDNRTALEMQYGEIKGASQVM